MTQAFESLYNPWADVCRPLIASHINFANSSEAITRSSELVWVFFINFIKDPVWAVVRVGLRVEKVVRFGPVWNGFSKSLKPVWANLCQFASLGDLCRKNRVKIFCSWGMSKKSSKGSRNINFWEAPLRGAPKKFQNFRLFIH